MFPTNSKLLLDIKYLTTSNLFNNDANVILSSLK